MKKIKQKISWIAIGDVGGRGLAFFTSVYLARSLGTEGYGLIVLAISVLGYATWFSDLGLVNIGTRETAKRVEKRAFRLVEIFQLKIILGLIALIVFYTGVQSLVESPIERQVLTAYIFSIIPYSLMVEWYFSGKQNFKAVAISKIINGALYFSLTYLLVHNLDDIMLVPLFYASGITAACAFLLYTALQEKPFVQPSRGLGLLFELLKSAFSLGTGKLFVQMVQLLPPILLGLIISVKSAGIYGAAFRIVIIAMLIDRIFVNLFLPNLAQKWVENPSLTRDNLNKVYKLLLATGGSIALLLAISAKNVIPLLYGQEYLQSIPVLEILSIMVGFTFLNSLFSFGLIATGHDRAYLKSTVTAGIGVLFLFCSSFFFENILIITFLVVVAEGAFMMSSYHWFKKIVPMKILPSLLIAGICCFIIYFLSGLLPQIPFLNALMGVFVYLLLLRILGILNKNDVDWALEKVFP